MLWPIRCMGRETVLIVGGLPVRHDMCDVNRQMHPCGKGCTRLCHGLNLQGGRRLLPKILRPRLCAAEQTQADAPAVAQIGCRQHIIQRPAADDIDRTVRINLHMVVLEKLSIVARRPVQVQFDTTPIVRGGTRERWSVQHPKVHQFLQCDAPHRSGGQSAAHAPSPCFASFIMMVRPRNPISPEAMLLVSSALP